VLGLTNVSVKAGQAQCAHQAGVSDRSTQLVSVSAAATVDVAALVLLEQSFLAYPATAAWAAYVTRSSRTGEAW
jgi:hypothetical protein